MIEVRGMHGSLCLRNFALMTSYRLAAAEEDLLCTPATCHNCQCLQPV